MDINFRLEYDYKRGTCTVLNTHYDPKEDIEVIDFEALFYCRHDALDFMVKMIAEVTS
jgi:hypothetical protein